MHYPQILPLVELFFDFHPPAVRPDGSIHFACAKQLPGFAQGFAGHGRANGSGGLCLSGKFKKMWVMGSRGERGSYFVCVEFAFF